LIEIDGIGELYDVRMVRDDGKKGLKNRHHIGGGFVFLIWKVEQYSRTKKLL